MRTRVLPVFLLAFVLAAPLAAYNIYLKDGSRISAREKYQVEGDRAIITLPNGTQSFIDLSEIDVQRTEEANRRGYGGALVLEEGRFRPVEEQAEPEQERRRLADLIAARQTQPRTPPEQRRETTPGPTDQLQLTRAGFPDLRTLNRTHFHNLEAASELQGLFRTHDLGAAAIHQGTRQTHMMVEITTNSEASVFRALAVSANALIHLRDRYPDDVHAFELLMLTPQRQRAGQFFMTPRLAADLLTQRIDVATFFVQQVQF